jgi:hypothetical protein
MDQKIDPPDLSPTHLIMFILELVYDLTLIKYYIY